MAASKTFSCIACGAPVEPVAGKTYMPCPYCGTNLAIPIELQRDTIPINSTYKIPEPKPVPEKAAADFLRKAQPAAIKAYNLYALWTWVRRFLPACLIVLAIAICLCTGSIILVVLQRGG